MKVRLENSLVGTREMEENYEIDLHLALTTVIHARLVNQFLFMLNSHAFSVVHFDWVCSSASPFILHVLIST